MTRFDEIQRENGEPIDIEELIDVIKECKYCVNNGACEYDMTQYNCRDGIKEWLMEEMTE